VRAPLGRGYGIFLRSLAFVANIGLVALVIVVLLAVVVRYLGVFPGSLHWATEFSRFSVVWIVMLGSAIAFHRGAHVAIDLTGLLPARWRRIARSAAHLLGLGFLTVLVWQGLRLSLATMGQISPALGLPMGYAYLAIPCGAAIMMLQSILFALSPALVGSDGGRPVDASQTSP
jgi:TRAP-type C4-dicarboxylate transport system permease small subunit